MPTVPKAGRRDRESVAEDYRVPLSVVRPSLGRQRAKSAEAITRSHRRVTLSVRSALVARFVLMGRLSVPPLEM